MGLVLTVGPPPTTVRCSPAPLPGREEPHPQRGKWETDHREVGALGRSLGSGGVRTGWGSGSRCGPSPDPPSRLAQLDTAALLALLAGDPLASRGALCRLSTPPPILLGH